MEIIARGAEAILYMDTLYGDEVLVKERIEKKYRISQIDEKLRRERTSRESKLITDSRSIGVNTPQILKIDDDDYKIIMEFIHGKKIKDFLEKADDDKIIDVCLEIGASIGKMHSHDIVHGDLTTSNIILESESGDIYFIDFGLGQYSKKDEDKGVDLKLLHDAIEAAHYDKLEICWDAILGGYKKEYKNYSEVIKKIEEIEGRARYAKRKKKIKGKK